jgi:hypothetical protein
MIAVGYAHSPSLASIDGLPEVDLDRPGCGWPACVGSEPLWRGEGPWLEAFRRIHETAHPPLLQGRRLQEAVLAPIQNKWHPPCS